MTSSIHTWADLTVLYFRDSCVYEKLGEDNGSLYCFTYENAIHFPVCEDPEPDTTLEEDISTTEGFQPFPPFPL